ncbi:MAG TPA: AAA family ATPase [Polyangiaceae bacterium]|nr:AAA family ATPase [Polyangiaceae bacterium]
MLKRLRIRGFALFEDISLELAPGLNVISGETGAGKSLVLSALALLVGARTGPWPIRDGCEEAHIEAEFDATARARIASLPAAAAGLVLRRVRRRSGKSAFFAGEELLNARRASELGRTLVEFAFQHAQFELDSSSAFLNALDAFAGQMPLRCEYSEVYAELCKAESDAAKLESELGTRELREARLRERLTLLARIRPTLGEHRAIRERLDVLSRGRDFLELAARVKAALCEREDCMEDELSALVRAAGRHTEAPPSVLGLVEALQRAAAEVQQAARAACRLELELDVEPAELAALERRRTELERAADVLGLRTEELGLELERAQHELAALEAAETRLAEISARRQAASGRARELAEVLHAKRCDAARELERRVEAELTELCLPDARLRLELRQNSGGALNAQGTSELAVALAANPGEAFGPLARVASGGERSRLLLALRALGIGREAGANGTLLFDEVDAGVGGSAAAAVALRLARLASERQVIVVTHQASIAARAGAHFRVDKHTRGGRTRARVQSLDASARVDELARMLSGRGQEESARVLARELLKRARSTQKRHAA